MLLPLLAVVVHLALDLNQSLLYVFLHLLKVLDLLVVLGGQLIEHVLCVVSLDDHLLVLFLQNGHLILQRFYVLLVVCLLLPQQLQLIKALPADLLDSLLAALKLILLISLQPI